MALQPITTPRPYGGTHHNQQPTQEQTMEILIFIAMYLVKPTLYTLMILSTIGAIIIISKSQ